MKKKLIVSAHVFGLCHSVNEGIFYALNHRNNIITELSLIPNAPGSKEAVEMTKKLKTSVSLEANFTTFEDRKSVV